MSDEQREGMDVTQEEREDPRPLREQLLERLEQLRLSKEECGQIFQVLVALGVVIPRLTQALDLVVAIEGMSTPEQPMFNEEGDANGTTLSKHFALHSLGVLRDMMPGTLEHIAWAAKMMPELIEGVGVFVPETKEQTKSIVLTDASGKTIH